MRAFLDGSDITRYCQLIRWRPKLSRPAQASIRYPARAFSATAGQQELTLTEAGSTLFIGDVHFPQYDGTADTAYAETTAYDHLIALKDRMVKTGSGNLIDPTSSADDAPGIMAEYIDNTIVFDPGPYALTVGSVAGGGLDANVDSLMQYPMNLEQLRALLVATGLMDVFLVPGSGSSVVNLTNGEGGSDLSGSVSYEFDTGSHNAAVATLTVDMAKVVNALWYLLAPRISQTQYKGSITPTAPHVGGTWPADLLADIAISRGLYNYRQEIQTKDEVGANTIRPYYEARWASEAALRAFPRTFASVKPNRGIFPAFRPGDLIHVAAGSSLNGGFSGSQRVYEFEVVTDADGINQVADLLTSADQG